MRLCGALVLAISIVAAPVRADERPTNSLHDDVAVRDRPPITAKRRAAAIALAIVPGVLVHGIGAWTVGEKRPAKKLLTGEVIGLGVAGLSGLLVGGSGGNPYTMPGIPFVVAGGGLLMQSWFTDIWIAAGGSAIIDQPRAVAPWSIELGTSWLHDAYRERALMRGGGRIELGRVGVGALALVDAGGDAEVAQGDVRVRLLGAPATGELVEDGSRLGVRVGSRWHRDAADRVTQWTQEIAIGGRLDLDRIDRAFSNSFAELGT
ncbi:MAG TPA: hypothetical protein VIV40_32465, partial [Kofleriaceae bacterium]